MTTTFKRTPCQRVVRERNAIVTDASLDLNLPTREILELARKRGNGVSSNLDTSPQSAAVTSAKSKMWGEHGSRDNSKLNACVDGYSPDDFAQTARLQMLEKRLDVLHSNPLAACRQHTKWRVDDATERQKNRTKIFLKILANAKSSPSVGSSNVYMRIGLNAFIKTLDGTNQTIIKLMDAGLSKTDVALQLGISRVALYKRLNQIKRLMKTWLGDDLAS